MKTEVHKFLQKWGSKYSYKALLDLSQAKSLNLYYHYSTDYQFVWSSLDHILLYKIVTITFHKSKPHIDREACSEGTSKQIFKQNGVI